MVAIVVAVSLAIATGLYVRSLLTHADQYLPSIETYLQKKTGMPVAIRHMDVGLFPSVTLRFYHTEIRNPQPFPAGDFLQAPQIVVTLATWKLLHKKIMVKSLVLEHPVFNFISDPDGLWNFQNPGSSQQSLLPSTDGTISKIQMKDGQLLGSALIEPHDLPGPILLHVQNFNAQFGKIDLHASANSASSRPIRGKMQSNEAVFGKIHLRNVRCGLEILPTQFTFKDFSAKTYRGQAHGDFIFNFAQKQTKFDTHLRISGVGVAYVLSEFENGPPKMTGMMEAKMHLNGVVEYTANPLAGIQGTGQVVIRDGAFPSLKNSGDMRQMMRFRESSAAKLPPSAFSSFSGDMNLNSHRIESKRIVMDFYGIGVRGGGNVNEVTGGLNYRGTAIIEKKPGFVVTSFARLFKGGHMKDGHLTFPIQISGTLSNPKCSIAE